MKAAVNIEFGCDRASAMEASTNTAVQRARSFDLLHSIILINNAKTHGKSENDAKFEYKGPATKKPHGKDANANMKNEAVNFKRKES